MSSPNPTVDGSSPHSQSGPVKHNTKKKKPKQQQHPQTYHNQNPGVQQGRNRLTYTELKKQQYQYSDYPDRYSQPNPNVSQYSRDLEGYNEEFNQYSGGRYLPQQEDHSQHHRHQGKQSSRRSPQYDPRHSQYEAQPNYSQHGPQVQQQQGHRPRGQGSRRPRSQHQLDNDQDSHGGSAKAKTKQQTKKPRKQFEDYWNITDVQQGLKREQLIQGAMRINPKNYRDGYIPHPDGQSDIYISGMTNRNRALNGDIVAVQLFQRDEWKVLLDDLNDLSVNDLEKSMPEMLIDGSSKNSRPPDSIESPNEAKSALDVDKTASAGNPDVDSEPDVITEEEYYEILEVDSSHDIEKQLESKETTAGVQKKHDPATTRNSKSQRVDQNNAKGTAAKQKTEKQTNTRSKQYTSLGDLVSDGSKLSPSAKKLFQHPKETTKHVPDDVLVRTGKVVYILEKKHSRACTGHIRLMQDNNPNLALFSPLDNRLPRILVPMADCPKDFLKRPEDHSKTLFIARITDWLDTSTYANGVLKRSLGEAGQIEPETEGILIENDVDFSEFSEEALACLPKQLPWSIPATEITTRKDLRKECIFTIDPATARDLDDALSCVPLDNGRYEIGVHIADVSFFLPPDTDLDTVAASRATSVYMVQKVIPMLPRLLCEQLCSLNPDEDRLTFSVIWTITENGTVESEWFGRSIIRSCVKLSYDHAQGFIEEPTREWTDDELPTISQGYSKKQIRDTVLLLDKVANKLRKHRFDNGALRLDQIKLQYALDKESGLPNGYYVYHQRDSNRLVEEFMLLANMAVARKIYNHYPETAVLRRHPQPQSRMIDDLGKLCRQLGIPLDVTNSRTIQQSLAVYSGDGEENKAKFLILTALCSKPMQVARYFCTGVLEDECLFHHYALNVPFYTHFTSPIRRYPDIMVHRLLAAALGYCSPPNDAKSDIQKEAEHCNDKKKSAKRCSDLSSELYFAVFVKECGPLEETGMVMAVLDKAFDVLIIKLGVIKRVYCEKLPLANYSYQKDKKKPQLNLTWKKDEAHPMEKQQFITIFTSVNCRLLADPDPLKWTAVALHPDDVISA